MTDSHVNSHDRSLLISSLSFDDMSSQFRERLRGELWKFRTIGAVWSF
jgi:hypothetical protein